MGNKKFDYTAQDAFAYQVLNKYIQSIKTDGVKVAQSASQNNVGEATTQTPPPSYQPQAQPQTPPPSCQQAPPQTAQALFLEVSSRHNILLLEMTMVFLSDLYG